MNNKVGERLKQLRTSHNYTQQEIADILGVTKATISKYETGQRRLNADYIERLSNLYGVEPYYILFGQTLAQANKEYEARMNQAEQEDRAYWESVLLSDTTIKISSLFDNLNEEGQRVAIERVKELTEIPKYKKLK